MSWKLYEADCFDVFPEIEDKSVDMILCDLPYGITACKWDTPLPLEELWVEYKRIIKDDGAIVLTASQPFTSQLVMSNPDMFKYELIWDKKSHSNPFVSKYRPLPRHENILIFSKESTVYNPQKYWNGVFKDYPIKNGKRSCELWGNNKNNYINDMKGWANPHSIISIIRESITASNEERTLNSLHPTQKPVALFEYLIKTYTNEHDLVLDNCAGSGTTGVACQNLNRDCILIEKEPGYCDIIRERMQTVQELQVEQRKQQTLLDYCTAK